MRRVLAFGFINNFAVGLYLVVLAWYASQRSGAELVGLIFAVSSATSMLLGPLVGVRVDAAEKRSTLLKAQFAKTVIGVLPLLAIATWSTLSIWVLLVIPFLASLSNSATALAVNPIVKGLYEGEKLKSALSYLSVARESGIVLGSVCAGYLMIFVEFEWAFAVFSVAAIAAGVVAWSLSPVPVEADHSQVSQAKRPISVRLRTTWQVLVSHSDSLHFAIIWVVLSGFAAFINTVLPLLIDLQLQSDSDIYGMIEAAYSVGGVLIGLVIGRFPSWIRSAGQDPTLAGIAISLVVAALIAIPSASILVHAIMGAFFSYGFIAAGARITEDVPQDKLGVVFSALRSVAAGGALLLYFAPSLMSFDNPSRAYFVAATVLFAISLLLLLMARVSHARKNVTG